MSQSRRSLSRFAAFVCFLACALPGPVQAQRILVSHPPLYNALLSASGRHLVAVIDNRFVVEDADQRLDLYRYTLDTGLWTRVPLAALVGTADPTVLDGVSLQMLSVSDDGRYVGYVVHRQPLQPFGAAGPSVLCRYDLLTGTRLVVRDAAADPFAQPVMSRDGQTFAWVGANNAVLMGTAGQTPVAVGQACAPSQATCPAGVALTANGDRVLYATLAGGEGLLETYDRPTNTRRRYEAFRFAPESPLAASASGAHVLATVALGGGSVVFDVASGRVQSIAQRVQERPVITDDGVYVSGATGGVFDRRLGAELPLRPLTAFPGAADVACCLYGLSADGRIGLARTLNDSRTVVIDLDGDADGLFDPWENTFGLSAADPADALQDPDADGVANSDEARLRSNPFGFHRRVFAEGVSSAYFDTTFHVFEVPTTQTGPRRTDGYVITFLGDNGARESTWRRRAFGEPPTIPAPTTLGTSQYATVVESEVPVAVERITSWGRPLAVGAHGTSGATPGTEWYFAEGATTGTFQLFYLLANTGEIDATVDIDYLPAAGARESRRYTIPAGQRRTVWVNQEGGALASAEVAARLRSTQPIVAERTMYTTGPGGFAAGTASMGVKAPSTLWRFAEGATGPVFDAFLLLANPSPGPAQVDLSFRLPDGESVARTVTVPAESRVTVWVDQEDARLADTAFSTMVVSDVPVIAERAMWWRHGSSAAWIDGHTEVGATTAATRWAVAEMPESAFLLIANAAPLPGQVSVTYYSEIGGGAASRTYDLPADGRVTAWPTQDNPALPPGRYRAEVVSLPMGSEPAVPIVVERAAYGAGLSTGTVYLATPVP
ncbi:DUF5719 family protein [Luteitalea sp.]